MLIEPSDIHYSQDSISKYFDRRSLHGTQTIGQTLDQVLIGYCSVRSIPTISVVRIRKHGDKWFSLDNRRLWVFKQLERLGYLDTIEVTCEVFDYYRHGRKITTNNGGISIRIRGDGDPEGKGHTFPDKCYPKLQKMLERERRKDDRSHMARKTISDRPTSRHHHISVIQDNVTKSAISKSSYANDECAGSNMPVKRDKTRTSKSSQQSNLFVGTFRSQCDGSSASFQTKTTQAMPVSYSSDNSSRMEQYHTPRSTPSNLHMFENNTFNSSRVPSAHSVFQRQNETIPFKDQRKTVSNDDVTFSDRLSRLRVTDTPKESHRYSDIPQENYHPIYNKHAVSDICEKSFDETTDGGFKTRIGYRTQSITDKTLKESETGRSGLYRTYTSDKSARKGNSRNINQMYFSGYNTGTKASMPSKYTTEDLAAYETSVDREHALRRKAETYGDYEHTCAADDVLKIRETHYVHARTLCDKPLSIPKQFCAAEDERSATAVVTKTGDRTSYCRPESEAYDYSGVLCLNVRSSTRCDRNSGPTRQQFATFVPTCTEEEVEINMSNLLYRQRHSHLLRSAWSTEAVDGSSGDSS